MEDYSRDREFVKTPSLDYNSSYNYIDHQLNIKMT